MLVEFYYYLFSFYFLGERESGIKAECKFLFFYYYFFFILGERDSGDKGWMKVFIIIIILFWRTSSGNKG